MIQTSLSDLIVIYLLMLLVATFGLWLLRDTFRRMREKRNSRNHFVCRICGVTFICRGKESLVRCPECESLNERSDCREI